MYLFNGDFIDRGPCSTETLLLLLILRERYPLYVFLNRGNHEADLKLGFNRELRDRFPDEAGKLYNKSICVFKAMQIAAVVDGGAEKAFVVHGGIPVSGSQPVKLKEIMQIDRQLEPPRDSDHLVTQALWNDPRRGSSDKTRQRDGYGQQFDCNDTRAFLDANDFKVVFRSHEMMGEGLREEHERCYTVFSALDGCAQYVIINRNLEKVLREVKVELREDQWKYLE
ncbi:putative serine/threonine protein phosphatase pfPp5 [Diaporthe sp. PMI_573]|nr:putative serine/threonine protein phosphatase pfPp5 [Diaporthaceae sp. PMI_573]